MSKVLVVDDDRSVAHLIREGLKEQALEVVSASSAAEAVERIPTERPDVVLLDVMLPETSGLKMFEQIQQLDTRLPIIFITADGASETAIEAMKLGAYDYVLKPLDLPHVRQIVQQALETRRLMQVPVELPHCDELRPVDALVGRSAAMLDVYKAIGRVAPQDVTVLVRGESGTGKELIARAIYQHSSRAGKTFLAVNCAAIPDSLMESELFGHEKGSFTGADRRRIGKFEQCSGGTIFLDEVGDMSLMVQSKLLRLLQEQEFERVGGNETIHTDVRIITATNRNLDEMVEQGKFRADLFYRLNGFTIHIPPLRDRGDDILLLLERYLNRYSRELDKDVHGISPDALKLLVHYPWPGNVRELQSIVKKSLLYSSGPVLVPEFLPDEVRLAQKDVASEGHVPGVSELERFVDERVGANTRDLYSEALTIVDRCIVSRVLKLTDGNQSRAAEVLGITRGSLRKKIQGLGISIRPMVLAEQAESEVLAGQE